MGCGNEKASQRGWTEAQAAEEVLSVLRAEDVEAGALGESGGLALPELPGDLWIHQWGVEGYHVGKGRVAVAAELAEDTGWVFDGLRWAGNECGLKR